MKTKVACMLALCMFAADAFAFDIEDVLSAPFPDAPVAAAQAPVIAWSANDRGVRNVWVARAPQFAPRALSAYRDDDGQPLGGLRLSDDGRWLAYVRGSAADVAGFSNNPDSDPDGVEQTVWLAPTDGASPPLRIAAGSAPLFSPKGDVLIVQGGKGPACYPLPGAEKRQWCLETMLKLRGSNTAVQFSPDGTRLAFVSNRGDRAFVGVLDLPARSVRWMAPDFARDSTPTWSADGKRIAFLRVAGARNGERFDLTAANSFEVWEADAATGAGRRLHRSNETAGGYAQFAIAEPLRYANDGRLIFASEQSGWLHWYAIPAGGGDAVALGRGACESESADMDAEGRVVFSANCDEIDHRQLYLADAKGAAPQRLTAVDEISTDTVWVAGSRWLALRHADARQPTAIAVRDRTSGGERRIFPATLPERFPLRSLIVPKTVRIRAADGLELHGQLFEPPAAASKRPALVYVHGGPVRQMLPGWHYLGYYNHDYAFNQWLASRGYVVLALNFRSGIGYGQAFRRAERQGPRGASEYQDVLAAHAYLRARPDVDPERIGIYGGSYGGYLTALALARNSDLFAAGVDRHGVHDWTLSAKGGDNSGLWGLREDELALARTSSPVANLSTWRSPALIVHGDDDRAVKFEQSTDLVARLRAQGVEVETLVFPGEEHMFLRHATWLELDRRTLGFFDRRLRGGR